ncbi:hypothetical protein AK812_SmicGene37419 [Symbiodinium microadriaticum]|uniref:Uncharacterized protein n=1 Tax=Symbiodinium microadriaticum TaxID=2951 RepID=A0A1Q9CGC2_SYMMI|nr:hypothetical protein AK812_SmicGene37419 [Symbiodinium microadriaticum]
MPGTGKTHLASQIASQLSQLGEGVDALQRAELWFGGADGGPMGAQDHPRGALLVEEVTQLNGPTSPSSPRTAESGFCCSGTFDSARAHGKPAQPREDLSPPAIPQVDEAEQVAGLLDTCLSYSHQRPGEPAGRAGGRCCWSTGQAGSRRTNKPQTMRFWLGLSLVTTSGRVRKGCCVTVREAGERIVLDDGQSFTPAELLRSTRFCHAITYASCQGLTLRGRVWLLQRISTSGIVHDCARPVRDWCTTGARQVHDRCTSCARLVHDPYATAPDGTADLPGCGAVPECGWRSRFSQKHWFATGARLVHDWCISTQAQNFGVL